MLGSKFRSGTSCWGEDASLLRTIEVPAADCIEEIAIKRSADTCTLNKGQQEPLLVRSASFPLGEMFFVTEEPHPLSVVEICHDL